jgi:trehalose-6-phosphatase
MAVETIIAEEGDAVIAYLGDDFTDEDAFSAIKGKGLSALVRPEWRPTSADVWIIPPEELLSFFDRWIEACR